MLREVHWYELPDIRIHVLEVTLETIWGHSRVRVFIGNRSKMPYWLIKYCISESGISVACNLWGGGGVCAWHMLFHCPKSDNINGRFQCILRDLWSGLNEGDRCIFANLMWVVWKTRCEYIYEGEMKRVSSILTRGYGLDKYRKKL